MALTKAQEEYLKGLGIGKGAGRGGAISGAGKGAKTGALVGSVVPGLGTVAGGVVGGLLGGIGGLFGGRGKAKKQQAEARAKLEQANATFNRAEDKRLAKFSAGQSLLQGLTGRGFTNIDPETAAQLGTRRELDPAEAGLWNQSAGAGSEAFSGVVDDAMDVASQYGINKGKGGGGGSSDVFSVGQPVDGLKTSFQDVMGTGGGTFGAGVPTLVEMQKLPPGFKNRGLPASHYQFGSDTEDFG